MVNQEQVDDVCAFLDSALPLAVAEDLPVSWYAPQIDDTTFGILDAAEDEDGRQAHLDGKIAAALMQKSDNLLAEPPTIQPVDVLAQKWVADECATEARSGADGNKIQLKTRPPADRQQGAF